MSELLEPSSPMISEDKDQLQWRFDEFLRMGDADRVQLINPGQRQRTTLSEVTIVDIRIQENNTKKIVKTAD